MDFIDEHNGAGTGLDLLHHRFQPLLEIAAVAGAGQKRSHVELVDGAVQQDFGDFAVDDLAGQALGDGGLADARVADEQRIVLLTAAEDLDGAVDLLLAADQRVDLAFAGFLVEVDAIGVERVALALLLRGVAFLVVLGISTAILLILIDAANGPRLRQPGALGYPVRNIIDRVIARHVLFLQEEGGMALALGEDGDEHVGAGHFLAARRLHMNDGALDDALESGGGF